MKSEDQTWLVTIACGEEFLVAATGLEHAIRKVRSHAKEQGYSSDAIVALKRLDVVVLP